MVGNLQLVLEVLRRREKRLRRLDIHHDGWLSLYVLLYVLYPGFPQFFYAIFIGDFSYS